MSGRLEQALDGAERTAAALDGARWWRPASLRRASSAHAMALAQVHEVLRCELEAARAARDEAAASRQLASGWARTELSSPRRPVREAAAGLLEALGEPVELPSGAVLLAHMAMALQGRTAAISWADLSSLLEHLRPGLYPVQTGMSLRGRAMAAGVPEAGFRYPGGLRVNGCLPGAVREAARPAGSRTRQEDGNPR